MLQSIKKILLNCVVLIVFCSQLFSQSLERINTGAVVKYPRVSLDGTKMIMVANYYGLFRPFVSDLLEDSAVWDTPMPVMQGVVADFEIRDPHFSADNSKIFFAGKTPEKPDFDIYYSELSKGVWSKPEPVPMGINTNQDELGPAISADEKKMLFTRPLPPEEKAEDFCGQLFYTELTETEEWSTPELLPPTYNTGCICTPYYSKDNKTFYYSSFEEVLDEGGKRVARNQFSILWAKIDGLFRYNPKPILSLIADEDLIAPSIDLDSTIYYASGQYAKGQSRIESAVLSKSVEKNFRPEQMTLIEGTIQDESGAPLDANLKAIDPFTTKVFLTVSTNQRGEYQLFVPMNRQYSLLASKEGYSTQSQIIETESTSEALNFQLFPSVEVSFNVFDEEFYFPIDASIDLLDKDFNVITTLELSAGQNTSIDLGEELNIIFNSENYFGDTLNLPFHEEVIFDFFSFDIELKRKLKDVTLAFTDEDGNSLGLEVVVFNVTRNEKTRRKVKDGKVSLKLRDGEVYEISTSAEGYSYFSEQLDLSDKKTKTEVSAKLKSIKNASLVLNNIGFASNSYELNATSYEELNKLVSYLSENGSFKVEISAHTDDSGGDAYNLKLSNLRANSVLEYLQDHSIPKARLVSTGFGEEKPLFPNDTEENRAKNRRVEFKILTE